MKKRIFILLADLRFAITILLVIAYSSIIGTIIEQDQSIEIYKLNYPLNNKAFGILSWDVIVNFGLDHVYKTWWFISLLIIFGVSLLICTFLQQIPSLKIARRCQFFRTGLSFSRLSFFQKSHQIDLSKFIFKVKENNYSIFQQRNLLYCYKGLVGRVAPIIVHFSMILILIGTIIGSIGGFKAQEIIPKTEVFNIQNILSNAQLTLIPNISTRVNDFWITYSKQKTITQFYSDISILTNNGVEINHKTIFVNSPLNFKGIDYYQTDWNLIALRIKDNYLNIVEYPLIKILNDKDKIWLSWVPSDFFLNNGFTFLINNLQGYCSIYNKLGIFIGNLELNEIIQLPVSIILVDIISSTGLQIKTDPGIPLIYTGFGLLMISTLISYFTYSQIWIVQEQNNVFIGGNTTRAIFTFELEFLNLLK